MTKHYGSDRDFGTDYDMNAEELAQNYDTVVPALHRHCPVAHSQIGEGYWVLNRREDVAKAASDWETFINSTGTAPDRPDDQPYLYPEECDPPLHTDLRSAVEPFFRPKAVKVYEGDIRRHALDLIAGLKSQNGDTVDVTTAYASALPGLVFCDTIAAMPAGDIPYLQATFDAAIIGPKGGRSAAMAEAFSYIEQFLLARSKDRGGTELVKAVLAVDCSWDIKVGLFADLTLGGIGTTGYVLASGLRYLAENPDEQAALRDDPTLLPAAVEEFLRFFAASPQLGRRVTREVEIGGVQMEPGAFVLLAFGAASRDPAIFDDPDEVNCRRSLPNRHIAFGAGIHRCIGMHLAKLQLRIGFEAFLSECPGFRIQEGFVPVEQIGLGRVLERLPLVLA